MYTIHDAHNKVYAMLLHSTLVLTMTCCVVQGVTALACTSDSKRVVSGGGEGQVRIWDVTPQGHSMREALKEHKGAVTCIKIRRNDEEVLDNI